VKGAEWDENLRGAASAAPVAAVKIACVIGSCCELIEMVPQIPPAVYEMVEKFAAIPETRRVILFGSRARGEARERSDIDLTISAPDADARVWDEYHRIVEESWKLLRVDLSNFEQLADVFHREVERDVVVLYDSEIPIQQSAPAR
jgi:predicted nucleotidyltransferase